VEQEKVGRAIEKVRKVRIEIRVQRKEKRDCIKWQGKGRRTGEIERKLDIELGQDWWQRR